MNSVASIIRVGFRDGRMEGSSGFVTERLAPMTDEPRRNRQRPRGEPARSALLACVLAVAASLAPAPAGAASPDVPAFLAPDELAQDFDAFCRVVADNYAYFTEKATDWLGACGQLRDDARAAADRDAYIGVLERAVGQLHDPHAHLAVNTAHSPRMVPTQADVMATWQGTRAVITDVRRGSPAEQAGVREGDEVVTIDGRDAAEAVSGFQPRPAAQGDPAARDWALEVALAGRHDTTPIRLGLRSASRVRDVTYAPSFPQPRERLRAASHGRIGIIRFNNSLGEDALVHDFDVALDAMLDLDALILDLRDTPSGGTSSVARGILGRLIDRERPYQRHELVSESYRTGVRRVWVEHVLPRGRPFRGPVVALVGPWTGSMGEGLAIGLDAAAGGLVMGRPMAHLLGALEAFTLPKSGIVVRIPTERLSHVDGTPRELFMPCPIPSPAASRGGAEDDELLAALGLLERHGLSAPSSHLACETRPQRR
jgi:carboxyl-terminal processing protease